MICWCITIIKNSKWSYSNNKCDKLLDSVQTVQCKNLKTGLIGSYKEKNISKQIQLTIFTVQNQLRWTVRKESHGRIWKIKGTLRCKCLYDTQKVKPKTPNNSKDLLKGLTGTKWWFTVFICSVVGTNMICIRELQNNKSRNGTFGVRTIIWHKIIWF